MLHLEAPLSDRPLGYGFNDGGLNNQKLALLGLFLEAQRTGRPLALPSFFNLDHAGGTRDPVSFATVYRQDVFLSYLQSAGVISADIPVDPEGRGWDFFAVGAQHIANEVAQERMRPDMPVCAFFRALVPVLRSRPEVSALRQWLHRNERPSLVVQLRIETDWQMFSAITLQPTLGSEEDYLPSFSDIIAKVMNTFGVDCGEIYVVCDEAALPVPREEIRRVCRDVFGITLWWKSDLLSPMMLASLSVLERSILDFDMALHASRFVGLTRSSFSNLVTFERYCMTEQAVRGHYVYNVPGPLVLERHDSGAYAIARAAVQVPA